MDECYPGATAGPIPTWEDVEREARHEPVLQHMVTRVRLGHLTREQALLVTVVWLSRERRTFIEREFQRLMCERPLQQAN